MSMASDQAEIREEAAQLIERHGWIPGRYRHSEHGLSMYRALALTAPEDYVQAVRDIRQELGVNALMVWESEAGRTKEEVLQALRGHPVSEGASR